jgi:hypothetical protein
MADQKPTVPAEGAVGAQKVLHCPDNVKEAEYVKRLKKAQEEFAVFENCIAEANKTALPRLYNVGVLICEVMGGPKAPYGERIVVNFAKDSGISPQYARRATAMVRTWTDKKRFLELVEKRGLTMSHMEALNAINDPGERRKMADEVAQSRLSVRDTKAAVKEKAKKDPSYVKSKSRSAAKARSPEEKKKRLTENPSKAVQYFLAKAQIFKDACGTLFMGMDGVKNLDYDGAVEFKKNLKELKTVSDEISQFAPELLKIVTATEIKLDAVISQGKQAVKDHKVAAKGKQAAATTAAKNTARQQADKANAASKKKAQTKAKGAAGNAKNKGKAKK